MIGNGNRRILIADYDQEVEIWDETAAVFGQGGNVKVKRFTALANVDVLSGNKALQYQQRGINNPVLIEMNYFENTPSYLMWNGNKIPITSMVDPDKHMKRRVIILGSYTK